MYVLKIFKLCAHEGICAGVCAHISRYLGKPEEGTGFPRAGVTGAVKYGNWRLHSGPQQEPSVLLTAEQSL